MPVSTSPDTIQFRLLGPVEVWSGSTLLPLGPPKRRAVLAALLVDAGASVSVDTLIDRVWDEGPPPEARSVLYSHLSRIRGILSELADTTHTPLALDRRSGGYLARLDAGLVDLHRSRDLVERARAPELSDRQRVEALRQALALWRGEPLAGLPGGWIGRIREDLRRQYLDLLLAWAQVELRLGHHGAVIDALYPQVLEHPTVEPLPLALMTALHAAGRSAEALDCYSATKRRLAEQLGTDPGPELRARHQEILCGQPIASSVDIRDDAVIPAQLPADLRGFAGQAGHLSALDELLASTEDSGRTGATIAAITGMPGVGKTALAVHWAHRVSGEFPDGQLYINLRGFDRDGAAVGTAEAIRGFLDALRVPAPDPSMSLDAQIGLYRSRLAERRMLVLLDNARDAEQVRPLLPGSSRCVVVVTSRDRLTGLVAGEGAYGLRLDPMSTQDARSLLSGRLGARRVAGEPDATEQIMLGCGRLPLALAVVVARAVAHPDFPLSALAAELRQSRDGLDAFAAGDTATDVRSVFSWSYQALRPDAAALFRRLGLHPGPDISVAAAASLAGAPVRAVRATLAELTRAHLLTEHSPGRFTCHDLLRAYAAELVVAQDPPAERRASTLRLLDHYLHSAYAAALIVDQQRDLIALAPAAAGVSPEAFTDHDQALDWFAAERAGLMGVIRLALDEGFDWHAWQLPWSLYTFLDYRGHWDEQTTVHGIALVAARRLADPRAQAYSLRNLGAANARLGRYDVAHDHFAEALAVDRQLNRPTDQARTHLNLAWLYGLQNRYPEALGHARQAWSLYSAAEHRAGLALAANSTGWYLGLMGDFTAAVRACRESIALHQEAGDRGGLAAAWDSLGFAHDGLLDHAEAATCYGHALDVLRELGDRYNQAKVLVHLGDSHQAAGDASRAAARWREALSTLDDLGHADAERVRAKLGG